ncbi:gliding motility-associated C-terminal domain-containing protein [Hymenobacter sp. AT01-02]|uniref:T9SS type B sorting domain-containing protein n=1 Tax=Hymenobacter sp. AT01-02 TaxID=1571877 RepID=UPI0009EB1F6A|nr:gliding motility-associated C-terminal domain-containing protein [Hymenobacter sp. AT01-02]
MPRAPTGGQLSYARNGSPIGSSSTRTFRDSLSTPTPSAAQCYTAQFLDACGNRSAVSTSVCPVVLTATATNEEGTNIQLNWTAFQSGATSTLTYLVISLSASNAVLSSTAVSSRLTFFDTSPPQNQQVVRYRIEATGPGLNAPTYSNVATVARQVKLFVPTAFSPNGDGLNDVLELKGRYLDNFRFTIIDRNGQQVFQSTSRTQSWDGRIGTASPVPGTYAWRYESTDQAGRRVVQHGSVTIVR